MPVVLQSSEIVSQSREPQDLIHRYQMQPIVNDLQNLLAAIVGGGTGNVTGANPTTVNAVPLWGNALGTSLIDSAIIGSAAGSLTIPVGQSLAINLIKDNGAILVIDDSGIGSGLGVSIAPVGELGLTSLGGNITVTAGGQIDFVANAISTLSITSTGLTALAGTVGAPSYSFIGQTDMGIYIVSGTQMGISVAGALQMTVDSAVGGIAVGTISELVGAAGVTIKGTGILTDQGLLAAARPWKLGDITAGASVLDATKYIEVEVNGVLYKLCVAV